MTSIKKRWASYVQEKRREKRIPRYELATRAGIDPSYITLIERDGYIPRKDKVIGLAHALGVSKDECLLYAGFAPLDTPLPVLLAACSGYERTADLASQGVC